MVSGNGRSVHAVAETHNDSADEQLSERVGALHASNLNDNTESHDESAQHDVLASTKHIAGPENKHSTSQTSDFVDSSDETLHSRVVLGFREEVVEGGGGNDTAHDTVEILSVFDFVLTQNSWCLFVDYSPLIIAEKKEASGGYSRDS